MRISDWSSDVCSSDLSHRGHVRRKRRAVAHPQVRYRHPAERDGPAASPRRLPGPARLFEGDPPPRIRSAQPRRYPRDRCESGKSEEHTSELQSLMRISYAVFCLKKKNTNKKNTRVTMTEY